MICQLKDFAFVDPITSGANSLAFQMEGKKRMDIETFLRGYPIPAGDVFVNRTQQ